ncbi:MULTISPECIES: TatD family hydrolase [Desulfosediminicola]|uniref:TatD family hydrolase n=1 Tax=Desulfosediminicola TaxID=2886823 RepID=UPI0010AC625B|nr:TatD family hydrolase [Desulfosediminicola ganghwensis]
MKLVDTHCHLDIERHFPDYETVIRGAEDVGVTDFVLAGVVRSGWSRMFMLGKSHSQLHVAPGLHPMYLHQHQRADLVKLKALAGNGHCVAIGEVGLDYFVKNLDHKMQQELFEAQVDIAKTYNLPLLLHIRKAHDQVLATLRRKRFDNGGIVHAFSGSYQQACHFIKLGFTLGICGTVTYDRALKIRRLATELPLKALVLETDAPDIPPMSHRGENNLPEYLPEILDCLAELRSEGKDEIARQTSLNAGRVLPRLLTNS